MITGTYHEDGWIAEVEVLADRCTEAQEEYELRVVRSVESPALGTGPSPGTIFTASRGRGMAWAGMWILEINQ